MVSVRLSKESIADCISHALPNSDANKVILVEFSQGAINDIYRLAIDDKHYCVRVRARNDIFAYEKTLLKEPIIGRFLEVMSYDDPRQPEMMLDGIIADVLERKLTGGAVPNPISPSILFYDQSLELIPYLWTLQEWVIGEPIDTGRDSARYSALGEMVAALHRTKFESFRRLLLSEWLPASRWLETCANEIGAISKAYDLRINLDAIVEPIKSSELSFALTHNDIQPLNIITTEERLFLIDWDNCQIAPPEFDLVKIKYWTARDPTGFLSGDLALYEAFLKGYMTRPGAAIDQEILRACEALWLCRAFRFEFERERSGRKPAPPFSNAIFYRHAIAKNMN
jgi:aminoglycoside phosphotransferase (APT) family kinase protein